MRALVAALLFVGVTACDPGRLWTFSEARRSGLDAAAISDVASPAEMNGADPSHKNDASPSPPSPLCIPPPAVALPVNKPDLKPSCPTMPCTLATCTVDTAGALHMTYDIDCNVASKAWGVCEFSINQNLAAFDTAYDAKGVIEVVFCVESDQMRGGLTLWYGKDPLRRLLRLVPYDQVVQRGCYVRYFTPEQARYPSWPAIPASCSDACGAGKATCAADFKAAVQQQIAASSPKDPSFDFQSTALQLAAESCKDTAQGTISLTSVKYLPEACPCADNASCSSPDRPTCRRVEAQDCPWPPSLPPGVCGPASIGCNGPPGVGAACTVSAGGKTCASTIECVEGKYVCALNGCQ